MSKKTKAKRPATENLLYFIKEDNELRSKFISKIMEFNKLYEKDWAKTKFIMYAINELERNMPNELQKDTLYWHLAIDGICQVEYGVIWEYLNSEIN